MDETLLQNRDYTIVIARTAAEEGIKPPGFAERWISAQNAVLALLQKCETFDPDGMTVYVACHAPEVCAFKKYEQVTSATLLPVLTENYPPDRVNLEQIMQTALDDYFERKEQGKTKANGEIMMVLLDGEPSDRMALVKAIKEATHKIDHEEELGIGFVQIGEDLLAEGFLHALDDNLKGVGAKFDIVNSTLMREIEPDSLTEFLLNTLHD